VLVEEDLNFFLLRVEIILLSYTTILYVSNYRTLICMYGAVFSEDCRAGVCVCVVLITLMCGCACVQGRGEACTPLIGESGRSRRPIVGRTLIERVGDVAPGQRGLTADDEIVADRQRQDAD